MESAPIKQHTESSVTQTQPSSGPIDLLTPSGKRLLRERPVKPSAKGMEWQLQSMSRGRGNRGHGNRGRLR
ncbi:unnamed protein product [Brassica oleracea]